MLLAILLPPVSVFFNASNPLLAMLGNIILCCLGWIPGVIHAFYVRSASKAEKEVSKTKQLLMEQKLLMAQQQGDERVIKEAKKEIEKEKEERMLKALVPFFVVGMLIFLYYYFS